MCRPFNAFVSFSLYSSFRKMSKWWGDVGESPLKMTVTTLFF